MTHANPSAPAHGEIGTAEEIAYEMRAQEASIWTGGRLLIGVMAFAYAALAFAYFYLRSSNSGDLWRPNNVTAPTAAGAAIMALAVASAATAWFGLRRLRQGYLIDWSIAWWCSVLGGLVAFGLQIWEMTDLPFYPGSSGYASVFVGWASMDLVLLITGVYWAETLLARNIRLRRAAKQEGAELALLVGDRMFRVNAETCAYYWGFIAGVSIFFWVFLYLAG